MCADVVAGCNPQRIAGACIFLVQSSAYTNYLTAIKGGPSTLAQRYDCPRGVPVRHHTRRKDQAQPQESHSESEINPVDAPSGVHARRGNGEHADDFFRRPSFEWATTHTNETGECGQSLESLARLRESAPARANVSGLKLVRLVSEDERDIRPIMERSNSDRSLETLRDD